MVDEFRVLFATSQALSLSGRIEGLVGLQEAVSHTAPVNLGSRDPATWVVAYPDATVGSPGGGSLVSSSEVATLSDHPKPATDYHLKTGQRE